jgi:hypothetical protein
LLLSLDSWLAKEPALTIDIGCKTENADREGRREMWLL